jgi:alanine racemase
VTSLRAVTAAPLARTAAPDAEPARPSQSAPADRFERAAPSHYARLAAAYVSRRATTIALDHAALGRNLAALKQHVGGSAICAVLKANGYGHGAVEVAQVARAAGVSRFAVATVAEGVELRAAGITDPILILGYTTPEEAEDVVRFDLTATVMTEAAARGLSQAAIAQGKTAQVHVKVNTGMNRLGVPPQDAPRLVAALEALPSLEVEGIFTHFGAAGSDAKATAAQLSSFESVVSALEQQGLRPKIVHAANSDAALTLPASRFDMVRVGTAIYGLQSGFGERVLSWQTQVANVAQVPAGGTVGYDAAYTAAAPRTIATIAVGWADGLAASGSKWKEVLVNGRRAPVVAVTMDQAMIDVSDVGPVQTGAPVVLIGTQGKEAITANEAAGWLGEGHPVNVVTRISRRSPSSTAASTADAKPVHRLRAGWNATRPSAAKST